MMNYPLAKNTIPQGDLDALADWLRAGPDRLTMGPLCREFEVRFAEWLGRKHAVFVTSGSSANWLMTAALKVWQPKARTLYVPAIGWPTTIAPAKLLGFDLDFLDAEPRTWGVQPKHMGGYLLTVHVLGVPAPMVESDTLMEDACGALGSERASRKVGTFGLMASFSFFYGHQMSTIEGGMVVTDDDHLADLLRMLRAHGWAADLEPDREREWWATTEDRWDFDRRFTFYVPGFNVRPTEPQGFLGLRQLNRFDEIVARRMANDTRYRERLAHADHLSIQHPSDGDRVCSIAIGVLARSPEHRAKLAYALDQAGIETRPIGGGNLARQPFINNAYQADRCRFADKIGRCGFQLPNGPHLSDQDVDVICEVVLKVKP